MMVLLAEKGIWENESLGMGMVEIIYSIWTGRMKGISETLMEMTRGWVSGLSGTLNHWTWRVLRSVVKTRVAFKNVSIHELTCGENTEQNSRKTSILGT